MANSSTTNATSRRLSKFRMKAIKELTEKNQNLEARLAELEK